MKISSEKAMQPECVLNIGNRQKENGKGESPGFSDMIVRILAMLYRPQGESLSSDQASAVEGKGDGDPLLGSTGISETARMTDPQAFQAGLHSAAVQETGSWMDAGPQNTGEQEAVPAVVPQAETGQEGAALSDAGTQSAGTSGSLLTDIHVQGSGIPGSLAPNVGLDSAGMQAAGPLPDVGLQNTGVQEAGSSPDAADSAGDQEDAPAGTPQAEAGQEGIRSQDAGEQSTGISRNPLLDVRLQNTKVQGVGAGPLPDAGLQNTGVQEAGLPPDAGIHNAEIREAVPADAPQAEAGKKGSGLQSTAIQDSGIREASPPLDTDLQGAGMPGSLAPAVGLHSAEVQETEAGLPSDAGIHNAEIREAVPTDAPQAEAGKKGSGLQSTAIQDSGIREASPSLNADLQGAGVPDGGDVRSVPADVKMASGPDFLQVRKEDSSGILPGGIENVGLPDSSAPVMEPAREIARQTPSPSMGNPVWKEDLSVSMSAAPKNILEEDINRKMDGKAGQVGNILEGSEASRTSFHPVIRNLEDIASRMTERVTMSRQENLSGLKVQLSPRELGEIEILVHMKDGHLSGTILVENSAAAEALEKQLPDLAGRLKEQNVRLQDVNISLQQNDAERGQGGENPFYRENRPVRRYFRRGIWKEEPICPETPSVSSRNAYPGWDTGFSLDRLI